MKLRQAHRNLNAKDSRSLWSFYPQGAKRVAHTGELVAYGVTMKQPSGKSFESTLRGGHRAVFAWIRAERFSTENVPACEGWERLRFNPTAGDEHFQDETGERIDAAAVVVLASDGRAYFKRG